MVVDTNACGQLDNLLDEAAERQPTLRESLALLVEREVARKDERRIEMGSTARGERPRCIRAASRPA